MADFGTVVAPGRVRFERPLTRSTERDELPDEWTHVVHPVDEAPA